MLGSFLVTKHFLPTRKPNASFVAVSTAAVNFPIAMQSGSSAYTSSKLAMISFFQFIAAETPDLQVVTIHPGLIDTAMARKSEMIGTLPLDDSKCSSSSSWNCTNLTVKLPAHFIIWSASKEAAFANGRFLWCNWDVTQLQENPKFKEDPLYCTANILPWPQF
jgi:NAD(P)-dependent dehydrogenase (short-subunit alcohol dehydrogenase family)